MNPSPYPADPTTAPQAGPAADAPTRLPGLEQLPEPWRAPVARALQQVADPELGESIVSLGLVHRLHLGPEGLCVHLLATSATCPMGDLLVDDTADALVLALGRGAPALAPELPVQVEIDWDVQWSPERMSPALRTRLGWPAP
ncbi:metal-sulfur cluster assembly factor [Ideonella livida]|uniref:Metal-sulfur cluster assembly factor n=1 Tax=Ideonella livida TaxID=2707176 RepID=A0A7C9PGX7_9BURK|nr:metal-sulfur cluster assembly factor [Ideonella livida]NDY91468.1 metal-sulfur cluster assembly factor [Ideonella livida]